MATKNISISVEAYERLRMMKEKNESFTDVINRITGKSSILEYAGILKGEVGEKLEKYIKERRALDNDRRARILRMLKDAT